MLKSKSYNRKTKSNKIKKEVREVYLRDDIWCGAASCSTCDSSAARLSASTILVVDTNVVLNQVLILHLLPFAFSFSLLFYALSETVSFFYFYVLD